MNSSETHHETYRSLDELITDLSEEDSINYSDIIHSMNLPKSAFEPFCSWSTESYTRNCIVENEKYELILLCWEKGQATPIHDHGGEECWVKVIHGEFRETIYKLDDHAALSEVKSTISKTGDISYMIDFMGYHRLENRSGSRAMSLHLYAKPIRTCKIFDEHSRKLVRKDLVYSTVSDKMTDLK